MIGEGPDEALLCVTDLYEFLNESDTIGNVGQWYFHNGSNVSLNMDNDIYMSLSSGLGVVGLHRKNDTLLPTGTFRCDILDSNENRQSIYVEVYYESISTTDSSLASDTDPISSDSDSSDPDSSHPYSSDAYSSLSGSELGNEATSSPTCCIPAGAGVSGAVIGGAGAGGLLLVLIVVAGIIILVTLSIKRY